MSIHPRIHVCLVSDGFVRQTVARVKLMFETRSGAMTVMSSLDSICAHFEVSETDLLRDDPVDLPGEAATARECLEILQLWRSIRDPDARQRCLDMLRSSAGTRGAPTVVPPQY